MWKAKPETFTGTRLHADQARRQIGDELQQLGARYFRPHQCRLTGLVCAMRGKDVLGEVKSNGYDIHDRRQMTTRALLTLVPMLLAVTLAAKEVPHDVAEFLRRAELCAHFRQEPWPEGKSAEDAERREFIVKQIEAFSIFQFRYEPERR